MTQAIPQYVMAAIVEFEGGKPASSLRLVRILAFLLGVVGFVVAFVIAFNGLYEPCPPDVVGNCSLGNQRGTNGVQGSVAALVAALIAAVVAVVVTFLALYFASRIKTDAGATRRAKRYEFIKGPSEGYDSYAFWDTNRKRRFVYRQPPEDKDTREALNKGEDIPDTRPYEEGWVAV